ncbi:MAG: ammonia-forming cytochrome c nitrite reductase subunit c552 [Mariniphaga sp.]|nr:ammonia-forming cytochrome c nitrite reductase subunit c552 [Mariniphaga sp.]
MAFNRLFWIFGLLLFSLLFSCTQRNKKTASVEDDFSGSGSCIQCHERFYELWSSSYHGKAMLQVDARFKAEEGVPSSEEFFLEGKNYQMFWQDTTLLMVEVSGEVKTNYTIQYSLGGKNVFTFLTPLDKGKLQTIPLAYDKNRQTWFNYPESAIRHFGEEAEDQALPWKDRMYTFNTGCYNCHVSQLENNFNLETETYHTTWREPGINCETCHGPSGEHVRVCLEAGEDNVPDDLKIISTNVFTPEQHNSSCSPCHAKMLPVTASYMPGEPYFDHFDLTTLEDPDFYPDGRDLGENYTYTGWKMNECANVGDLHCVTCHTSSGRDRYAEKPNDACMSCHQERRENLKAHTMHEPDSEGSVCINCHMPTREFVGHFLRSDHSFRPPMPEATIKFGSPNACNQCHTDKSPEWANTIVKKRKNADYQEKTLYWAQLIKEARDQKWNRLDEMLQIISENRYNNVVVASFLRLLPNCRDEKKWDTVIDALETNESPLVRAAAAISLGGNFSEKAKKALLKAAGDPLRLVRVYAASTLAGFDDDRFSPTEVQSMTGATHEYISSLLARPDDWSSHYNKGIFFQNKGDANQALDAYETAARLYPQALMPLINSSVLYSYIGNHSKAEENLEKVLEIDPENEAANLNLGLLLAEQGRTTEAEAALVNALNANPQQAVAAYNLSVLVSSHNPELAVQYAHVAAEARPGEPKYSYTLAYYQLQIDRQTDAIKTLKKLIDNHPQYLNAVSLLADIYSREGKMKEVKALYEKALKTDGISMQDRNALQESLRALQNSNPK